MDDTLSVRRLLEGMAVQSFTCSPEPFPVYNRRIDLKISGFFKREDLGAVIVAMHTFERERGLPPIEARDINPEHRSRLLRELIACATPKELEDYAVCVDAALSGRTIA